MLGMVRLGGFGLLCRFGFRGIGGFCGGFGCRLGRRPGVDLLQRGGVGEAVGGVQRIPAGVQTVFQHPDLGHRVAGVLNMQVGGGNVGSEADPDLAEQMHPAVGGVVDDAAGDHVGSRRAGHHKGAALDLADAAVLGAGPLGEDQHAVALFHQRSHFAQGADIPLAAGDGHRAQAAQAPADERIAEQLLLGNDAHPAPAEDADADKDRVDIGNVIGCHHIAPTGLVANEIFPSCHFNAPEQMPEQPGKRQTDPIQNHSCILAFISLLLPRHTKYAGRFLFLPSVPVHASGSAEAVAGNWVSVLPLPGPG